MNELQRGNFFAANHEFDQWTVWFFQRETIRTTPLKSLPVLNGIYLLSDTGTGCYLGETMHACRRLRSHTHEWKSAICVTRHNRLLSEDNRKHIEFALGLMFANTGTRLRNRNFIYPKYDPESMRLAQSFIREVFRPLSGIYGNEFGLPGLGVKNALAQVHKVLGKFS